MSTRQTLRLTLCTPLDETVDTNAIGRGVCHQLGTVYLTHDSGHHELPSACTSSPAHLVQLGRLILVSHDGAELLLRPESRDLVQASARREMDVRALGEDELALGVERRASSLSFCRQRSAIPLSAHL